MRTAVALVRTQRVACVRLLRYSYVPYPAFNMSVMQKRLSTTACGPKLVRRNWNNLQLYNVTQCIKTWMVTSWGMWPEIAKSLCNTVLGNMIRNVKPYLRHLSHASAFSMTWSLAADDSTNNPIETITMHRKTEATHRTYYDRKSNT